MEYQVGGKLLSKKTHACGGNEWIVMRTGADIKLKCEKCGRAIFISIDQADKMKKKYISGNETNND